MTDKEIGQRIAQLRDDRGWSQGQLAERAHVSREHISKLEAGERRLTAEIAEKLAPRLGVSPAYLRGLVDDGHTLDPNIAGINANLLTMRELDPSELRRVEVLVQAMVDDLMKRRREEDNAERRRNASQQTGPADS